MWRLGACSALISSGTGSSRRSSKSKTAHRFAARRCARFFLAAPELKPKPKETAHGHQDASLPVEYYCGDDVVKPLVAEIQHCGIEPLKNKDGITSDKLIVYFSGREESPRVQPHQLGRDRRDHRRRRYRPLGRPPHLFVREPGARRWQDGELRPCPRGIGTPTEEGGTAPKAPTPKANGGTNSAAPTSPTNRSSRR